MAAVANLRIDQGASFSSDVTVTNSDGNAVDLAGYTAEAKLASSYGSSTYVSFTTLIAADTSTGVISISLIRDSRTIGSMSLVAAGSTLNPSPQL